MPTILGSIVRLQVQRDPLKIGEKPDRRYVPDPIQPVERALVSADGMLGLSDGREIIDVHNRRHPATRNDHGRNALSVGFTAHYRAMRERFGNHITPGCAGENILVDIHRMVRLDELVGGLVILSHGGEERVRLSGVCVARPCKPFSGFVHQHQIVPAESLKATLAFLDEGMRGFYCTAPTNTPAPIRVGDVLAIVT
jgi:hypothetical protein